MEREPIRREQTEAEKLFFEVYKIPLSWAKQMAQFDNDLGRHWKGVLNFLSRPQEEGIIYDRSKTQSSKRPRR